MQRRLSSSSSDEETSVVTETAISLVPPALLLQTAVSGTNNCFRYQATQWCTCQQFLVCDADWFNVYLRCVYGGTGSKVASLTSFEVKLLNKIWQLVVTFHIQQLTSTIAPLVDAVHLNCTVNEEFYIS